jgi:tetratricopeptide (TPR) repeat protein
MVLDNADDDDVFFVADEGSGGISHNSDITNRTRPLESFLPQTPNGTILVTSRNSIAAINLVGPHGGIVEVEPMGEEDALALLNVRVPFSESSKDDAKALVQALERIPLAISHAAAYIKTRAPMTTMSGYLELFRESEANQVRLLGQNGLKDLRRDYSIQHAVIATWQISFTQIQKTKQSAADLLALMSMFDRQGIPISLLQANAGRLDLEDALTPLLSFSFLRAEVGQQSFEMHRLVQLSTRTWLQANKQFDRWRKESIRVLTKAFPSGDHETWMECQVLLPHSKEVISHMANDREDLLDQATIADRTSWYLICRGEYVSAETISRIGVEAREKALGPEHPHTLSSVNDLGMAFLGQGKYEEAEVMQRRALEGYEKVLGPEHPGTLASVSQLGSVLLRQGKHEEAEAMQRRALEGCEKVLGPENPYTLTSVSQLSSVLERQGKHKEAEAIQRRALEGCEKVLGLEHPQTLTSVNNLGSVLWNRGKYKEAEAMQRRALEGYEKVLGPDHPDTLTSMANIASTFSNQRQWKEAEQLEVHVLETRKKVLGAEHPATLISMNNLAFTLRRRGCSHDAISLMEKCLQLRKRILGPHHPDTESSIETLNKWQMENRG